MIGIIRYLWILFAGDKKENAENCKDEYNKDYALLHDDPFPEYILAYLYATTLIVCH